MKRLIAVILSLSISIYLIGYNNYPNKSTNVNAEYVYENGQYVTYYGNLKYAYQRISVQMAEIM